MENRSGAATQPQEVETLTARPRLTIGLPRCTVPGERRFPLTPDAVRSLTERGYQVKIEEGAPRSICYTDEAYARAGAVITDRGRALECDMVIHLAPLGMADIRRLRRGSMLFTLANFHRPQAADVIRQLLDRHIINIAIDLITDRDGNRPFADILSEIAGRAAIVLAAGMMADTARGKGILPGGVAGVIPCEVLVLGSDLGACAAARSAIGLGATVQMFDGDVYRLRRALRDLYGTVTGSSIHPHALENALRRADVVISTDLEDCPVKVDADGVELMKRGVLVFDLSCDPGHVFPSLPTVDVAVPDSRQCAGAPLSGADAPARRVCYVNAGSAVPRTAAMALSDTFITLLDDIAGCEGRQKAIMLTAGMQEAVLTFLGKAVNRRVARMAGVKWTDIRLLMLS